MFARPAQSFDLDSGSRPDDWRFVQPEVGRGQPAYDENLERQEECYYGHV